MIKEDKNQLLDALTEQLKASETVYLTDISDLDAEKTSKLRRLCFRRDVKLMVVKNTLLRLAMERSEKDFTGLYDVLKGHTSLMFSENSNTPARLIQEFRRESNRPVLKGAYVQEMVFVGDDKLDTLVSLKSKNEMLGDIISTLQSPMRNVLGALQSGGHILSGVLKTLSEKAA
ncbi:MAG: 50S ribosomal protein L10 [Lentimicrobiaceae bacterium]|nr:50S ribosomal protein L10 [Lentimicrobiaceae bacterium]